MASDKGQESPRKRKGRNTSTTAKAVPKRQKVGQGQGNAQPMTRRSECAPRLTERAKEAWCVMFALLGLKVNTNTSNRGDGKPTRKGKGVQR